MNDKDWLDRVDLASKHYDAMTEASKEAIDQFVKWMYTLYGITPPEKRKEDK